MPNETPSRRLTLRQLLTQSEKCTRDLIDFCHATLLTRVSDFRDLSRPVRRRSQYPTMVAVQNSLKKLQESHQEARVLTDYLHEQLSEIQERARKERAGRAESW